MKKIILIKKISGIILAISMVGAFASISIAATGPNLIANPSVEQIDATNSRLPIFFAQPVSWSKIHDPRNISFFYYPVTGHASSKAVKVQVLYYKTNKEGWNSGSVNIDPTQQYTFSDYYISNVANYVTANFQLANGTLAQTDLAQAPASLQWAQYSATITPPVGAVSVSIIHYLKSAGTLTTDDYSLAQIIPDNNPPPPPPPTTNLIPNPLLENQTGNFPTSWSSGSWGTNDAVFNYPVAGFTGNGASVTINNYVSGDAKWYSNPVAVTAGKYYFFSDEYMATSPTQVVVQFTASDGTSSYQEIGIPAASLTWQNFQAGFNVPLGVNSLTIFHLLNSAGTLTTDNFSLVQTTNPNAFSKGMVSLTFDDGWQTNYDTAIPILNSAGLKSTQYIITGSIGDTADGYMTLSELKTIYQQGHEITAHTRTHPDLTAPGVDLQSEINGSRSDLLSQGFSPVNSIAYPFGRYNSTIQADATAAGFIGGRSIDLGYNDKSTSPLALKVQIVERGGICGTDNAPATTLDQIKNWIDTAAATNTWLILVFHQTDNNFANCYGDTPQTLQSIVDYLKASNVNVTTVTQGLQNMK